MNFDILYIFFLSIYIYISIYLNSIKMSNDAFTETGAVPLYPVKNTKPDSFFDIPEQQTNTTTIIIVAFVLIILTIIFIGYIVKQTNYSQMYTNLVIIVSAIIAITTVLLVSKPHDRSVPQRP